MEKTFDVIVIGTGAAGTTVVSACRSAGREVAVADSRPYGGTCALRGCDPKKVLVGAAEAIDAYRRLEKKRIFSESVQLEWPALMRFKRTFTEGVSESREQGYRKAGAETFHGRACFTGAGSLRCGEHLLKGRNIVVASGARPAWLGIGGEELLTTSEQFLQLEKLPARVLFVGGGYISFEFAHIAARAGAKVTILHRGSLPLRGFDPGLVRQLVRASEEIGIDVRLDTQVDGIETSGGGLAVFSSAGGIQRRFDTDIAVHGAGRVPELEGLDLDRAGVEHDEKGITVNEYLQSVSNPSVYAAGDAAAAGRPLTPAATAEGKLVAHNILNEERRKFDAEPTPTVVFTVPPLASVGLLEEQAREKGLKFMVNAGDTSGWYTSRRQGITHSGYKLLIEEGSGLVLGAHVLGSHAEEVINIFALAMRFGIRASDLGDIIYTYPTTSSDIRYMV
jgi:glutathione reductase (NADPH)